MVYFKKKSVVFFFSRIVNLITIMLRIITILDISIQHFKHYILCIKCIVCSFFYFVSITQQTNLNLQLRHNIIIIILFTFEVNYGFFQIFILLEDESCIIEVRATLLMASVRFVVGCKL